jgi:hypothetical protein
MTTPTDKGGMGFEQGQNGLCLFFNPKTLMRIAWESIYIKRDHFGTKKKTIFKAPPSPFQYLGRAWGESKGPIGTFQDLYIAPKGAFECLFGGLKLIKCAVYL